MYMCIHAHTHTYMQRKRCRHRLFRTHTHIRRKSMLHQMHAGGINARFLRRLRPLPSPQTSVSSAPLSLWPLCSPYLSSVKRAIGNSVLSNAHAPQPCRYAVANAFRFRARTTEHIPFHSTCGIHSHTHVYCMRVYTGYSVEIDLF